MPSTRPSRRCRRPGPAPPRCVKRGAEPTLRAWTSACPATTTPAAPRCGTGSTSTRTPPAASWPRPATWRRTGPRPYGLDADPLTQLMIDEELRRKGVRRPINPIGIGWAGPTLMYAGTEEQKDRWLWPLLSGEDFWCQLFSEPGAGSDLAALTHPGRARRRPLGRQRAEGVDQLRAHRQVGDPAGPHGSDGHQAHGDQLLRLPHGCAGDRHPAADRHDGGARLQRGVPDRRAHPGRPPGRARARRMGAGQGHPRATSGCRCRARGRCGGWARRPRISWIWSGAPAGRRAGRRDPCGTAWSTSG